jgi:two-component system, NarL family, response regulator NreC
MDGPMSITILLADDHAVVRLGVRSLFEAEPDFQLVGEAAEGLDVMALVEKLQPDVLVLDLMMPGLGGLELLRQTARRAPQTHVVILSLHGNEAYVAEALSNGALGYVLKGSDADELVRAVRHAAAGERYLSPPLSERTIANYVEQAQGSAPDLYDTLTLREREVLHLAAEGHTSSEIGRRLFISPRTVETHRGNLMHKLGLDTQTDLVRYALRRGIVPLDE